MIDDDPIIYSILDPLARLQQRQKKVKTEEEEAVIVSLLEDRVARGDAAAMVKLAMHCAFGKGIKQNSIRAEALLSEAKNRSETAKELISLIEKCKTESANGSECLLMFLKLTFCLLMNRWMTPDNLGK